MADVTGQDLFFSSSLYFIPHSFCSSYLILFLIIFQSFSFQLPMRKCFRELSCMSSPFSIAILNGTRSLRSTKRAKNVEWMFTVECFQQCKPRLLIRRWNRFCDPMKKKNCMWRRREVQRKLVVENFSQTFVRNAFYFLSIRSL